MATSAERPSREAWVDALTLRFRQEVDRTLDELEQPGVPVTLDGIEAVVTTVKERLGRELQQGILDQQPEAPENRVGCPACLLPARFRERRM